MWGARPRHPLPPAAVGSLRPAWTSCALRSSQGQLMITGDVDGLWGPTPSPLVPPGLSPLGPLPTATFGDVSGCEQGAFWTLGEGQVSRHLAEWQKRCDRLQDLRSRLGLRGAAQGYALGPACKAATTASRSSCLCPRCCWGWVARHSFPRGGAG